jgi:hypothetical protein
LSNHQRVLAGYSLIFQPAGQIPSGFATQFRLRQFALEIGN